MSVNRVSTIGGLPVSLIPAWCSRYCLFIWFWLFWYIKAAIFMCMDACDQVPLILPKMQDPKSLMLCWRSFSRWGRECFTSFFCNKGGQYFVYDCFWPVAPPDYARYTTNNHWRSIDAQFQDVVGPVCIFVLIFKAANTSNMDCYVPMSIFYDQQ